MTSIAPDSRVHLRRLRDVYRSAGWPCQDTVEIELLAAGLLERCPGGDAQERVRLSDAGIAFLAAALARNKRSLGAHDRLVARVAAEMQRAGRLVWTDLSLRARLDGEPGSANDVQRQGEVIPGDGVPPPPRPRWKLCRPDVFSIRHTSVAAYLEPTVHEVKVSRADLLGDLHAADKRDSYLDVAGQCWYVLGCDRRGRPIAEADEIPAACGVMVAWPDDRLEVLRPAPRPAAAELPFALWMALAKATPWPAPASDPAGEPEQAWLQDSA